MIEKNLRQEFGSKNIEESKKCFVKEIAQNELIYKEGRKVCTVLNCIEHLLFSASVVTGCIQFLILLLCLVFL